MTISRNERSSFDEYVHCAINETSFISDGQRREFSESVIPKRPLILIICKFKSAFSRPFWRSEP
jgi:hypothetical protein